MCGGAMDWVSNAIGNTVDRVVSNPIPTALAFATGQPELAGEDFLAEEGADQFADELVEGGASGVDEINNAAAGSITKGLPAGTTSPFLENAAGTAAGTALGNSMQAPAPVESRLVPTSSQNMLPSSAGNVASAVTGSGAVGNFIDSPLGKTLGSAGLQLGMGAMSAARQEKASNAFNSQLSQLINRSNNASFDASQATPLGAVNLSPRESATLQGGGTAQNPEATLAGSGRPAPASPSTFSLNGGTTPAPDMFGDTQTGAVKLGQRPQMYA